MKRGIFRRSIRQKGYFIAAGLAWTQSELRDQWWVPKPYRNKTKSMDFRVGGFWLYSMIGPEGQTYRSRADHKSIKDQESFTALAGFCDEEGKVFEYCLFYSKPLNVCLISEIVKLFPKIP